jgi:hypothetical protein
MMKRGSYENSENDKNQNKSKNTFFQNTVTVPKQYRNVPSQRRG